MLLSLRSGRIVAKTGQSLPDQINIRLDTSVVPLPNRGIPPWTIAAMVREMCATAVTLMKELRLDGGFRVDNVRRFRTSSTSTKGGAKMDHETQGKRRFVAVGSR